MHNYLNSKIFWSLTWLGKSQKPDIQFPYLWNANKMLLLVINLMPATGPLPAGMSNLICGGARGTLEVVGFSPGSDVPLPQVHAAHRAWMLSSCFVWQTAAHFGKQHSARLPEETPLAPPQAALQKVWSPALPRKQLSLWLYLEFRVSALPHAQFQHHPKGQFPVIPACDTSASCAVQWTMNASFPTMSGF